MVSVVLIRLFYDPIIPNDNVACIHTLIHIHVCFADQSASVVFQIAILLNDYANVSLE